MRYNRSPYNRSPYNRDSTEITPPPTDGDLTISGSISRNLSQKSWTARVKYNKTTTAGVDSATFANQTITLKAQDHNDVTRTVFLGYFSSEDMTIAPGTRGEVLKGFDHAQKLTNRVVPANLITLLKPNQQYTGYYQRLDFDYVVNNFTAGKTIKGVTSGAVGIIIATQNTWVYDNAGNPIYLVPSGSLALSYISGTFQDNETIKEVGSSGEALVNGVVSQIDILATIVMPQDYIFAMLGGIRWQTETGCLPYRINPVNPVYDGSWNTPGYDTWTPAGTGRYVPPAFKQWSWKRKQTRQNIIDDLSEYYNFIFYVKWMNDGSETWPRAYWVHQDDIDNPDDYALTEHRGLGLPAAVTIVPADPYLIHPVTNTMRGDTGKTKIIIRGQDLITGVWYENAQVPDITGNEDTCTCSSGVYYGTEIPDEYYDDTENRLSTQADVQAMAHLIYLYQKSGATTWTATFKKRFDLVLLQKMIFSGFTANEIPDDTYRIIGISYDLAPPGGSVTVTLIRNSQYSITSMKSRVFVNKTLEMQRVFKAESVKNPVNEACDIIADNGDGTYVVVVESGQIKTLRGLTE